MNTLLSVALVLLKTASSLIGVFSFLAALMAFKLAIGSQQIIEVAQHEIARWVVVTAIFLSIIFVNVLVRRTETVLTLKWITGITHKYLYSGSGDSDLQCGSMIEERENKIRLYSLFLRLLILLACSLYLANSLAILFLAMSIAFIAIVMKLQHAKLHSTTDSSRHTSITPVDFNLDLMNPKQYESYLKSIGVIERQNQHNDIDLILANMGHLFFFTCCSALIIYPLNDFSGFRLLAVIFIVRFIGESVIGLGVFLAKIRWAKI